MAVKVSALVQRVLEGPAPVAPPKPDVKPAPTRPEEPRRKKFPSPWRRKDIKPGEEPAPKACRESMPSTAKALIIEATAAEWTSSTPRRYFQGGQKLDYADPGRASEVMDIIRQRFMDERIKGFPHPRTGKMMPPMSPEEAEKLWQKNVPGLEAILYGDDPEVTQRLRIPRRPVDFSV